MPVLPDVPSMIVPPGFSRPARSASSIIWTAIRSLIELPGLKVSILASTVPPDDALGDPVDADHRRVADGVEDGVADLLHEFKSILRRRLTAEPQGPQKLLSRFSASAIRILMPRLIAAPTVVAAAGTKPKRIEEFAGRVNSGHAQVSVARMTSPSGWQEPGQRPEFEEITVVLRGMLRVEHDGGALEVQAGQAVVTAPGEWMRYSTPDPDGAEYVAVCLPAFSPATVHRDE